MCVLSDEDEDDVAASNRFAGLVLPNLSFVVLVERAVRDTMQGLLLGLREEAVFEAVVLIKLETDEDSQSSHLCSSLIYNLLAFTCPHHPALAELGEGGSNRRHPEGNDVPG